LLLKVKNSLKAKNAPGIDLKLEVVVTIGYSHLRAVRRKPWIFKEVCDYEKSTWWFLSH
jgi:hypothetical protein